MAMYAKMHRKGTLTMLAACDKELIGKKLKGEKTSIKVGELFYKGKEVGEQELKEMLKEADSINLIGQKVVSIAIKENWATEKNCIYFGKVPHLQIFKV